MLRLLLEDLTYRVLVTVNGQDALDLASKETPDLILTDFNLPDMTGTELIRRIRGLGGRLSQIPIVMLTAYGRDIVRDSAIAAGCNAFFSKPLNFTILQEAIEQLLVESREINGSVNDH